MRSRRAVGQVLAHVVGTDREARDGPGRRDGELDARRPAVGEQRLDRGADRPAGVEDVVDEDARHPLEREVEPGGLHDRLRRERRSAAANAHVVAVEGDVHRSEGDLVPRELRDQPSQALRERHSARVDPDEGEPVEIGVALDDLVGDAHQGAPQRLAVEQ